jgi:hypothetical protein
MVVSLHARTHPPERHQRHATHLRKCSHPGCPRARWIGGGHGGAPHEAPGGAGERRWGACTRTQLVARVPGAPLPTRDAYAMPCAACVRFPCWQPAVLRRIAADTGEVLRRRGRGWCSQPSHTWATPAAAAAAERASSPTQASCVQRRHAMRGAHLSAVTHGYHTEPCMSPPALRTLPFPNARHASTCVIAVHVCACTSTTVISSTALRFEVPRTPAHATSRRGR